MSTHVHFLKPITRVIRPKTPHLEKSQSSNLNQSNVEGQN